jgi:hypothetical protein
VSPTVKNTDAREAECPRCHQQVELYADRTGRMRAHRDIRIGCSCPLGGLTIQDAQTAIDVLRERGAAATERDRRGAA